MRIDRNLLKTLTSLIDSLFFKGPGELNNCHSPGRRKVIAGPSL
jgi:hypothetical protein